MSIYGGMSEFTRILASDTDLERVSQQAIGAVAEELRLGRMEMLVSAPPHAPKQEKALTLYENGHPCEAAYSLERTWKMENGAMAVIRAFQTADAAPWTDQERIGLDTVIDFCVMHSERASLMEAARLNALTQYLTGLPNSGGYMQQAAQKIAQGSIGDYDAYYMNLKGTSILNIKFGQQEADEVIKRYAQTLRKLLQEDELLGHLGGDIFVALVRKEHADLFRQKLRGTESWAIRNGKRVPVTVVAAAGVMHINGDLPGAWSLISWPSIAWQHAKFSGKNYVMLTQEMVRRYNRARLVENSFYHALQTGEFRPYYQPKVDMRTGKIIGAEVLARWVCGGQVIPPMDFIPELEHTEKIVDLDLYILEEACRDLKAWREKNQRAVPLSVNISRRDVGLPGIVERIQACFKRYGVQKNELIIEITETANELESSQMKLFVDQLVRLNISTSIDDFGTGYSSLGFLRDFPVRELKIDRSFINHPLFQDKDRVIIGSMINMAKQLHMSIITEGVETVEQMNFLLELGCNQAQGFLFDQPLPREQFEDRMRRGCYAIHGHSEDASCQSLN